MIPNTFEYKKAGSVDEAISLISAGSDSKLLAGGHSLIPTMKLRLNSPSQLVDIARLSELNFINTDGDWLAIGAATTHYEIESSEDVIANAPVLSEGAGSIGDIQVRNKGTIGGSIAHADPAADYPAILMAYEATINVKGSGGERIIAAIDFFKGLFQTDLADEEIITEIRIPLKGTPSKGCYLKFPQPASRFAIVGVACLIESEGNKCTAIRLGINGLSDHAFRASESESALLNKELTTDNIATAAAKVADGISVMSDHFADTEYRSHLAKVFVSRAINKLIG